MNNEDFELYLRQGNMTENTLLNSIQDLIKFVFLFRGKRPNNYCKTEYIKLTKDLISQYLGVHTTHLLWPRGEYDATLLRTAKKMEFNAFYIRQEGLNLQDSLLEENKYYPMCDSLWHLKKFLFICGSSLRYKTLKAFL